MEALDDVSGTWILILVIIILIFSIYFHGANQGLPGPWGLPIFGTSLFIRNSQYETFGRWSKKYGPLLKTRIGFNDVIIIDDSGIMREALNNPAFTGRGDNKVLNIITGGKYGITSNEGPDWAELEQRRFVMKHLRDFGFGKQSMEGIILAEVEDFLKWAQEGQNNPTLTNKSLTLATLNSLWTIVAGRRNRQDDTRLSSIIDVADEALQSLARKSLFVLFPKLVEILPNCFLGPWNKAKEAMEGMNEFVENAIKEHRQSPCDDGNPRDLIDVYLTANKNTADETSSFYKEKGDKSLVAVVKDLFAAGAGATSETINWAILYLITHAHVQKKLQEEIDAVIGRNRSPTLTDKNQMPYTGAFMNEVLRCSSVAPTIFHFTIKDTSLRGYAIKKNSTVISNAYSIHHNGGIWGDPDNFRPERFLLEDGSGLINSEHLLPFGIGRRHCIGETFARNTFFLFITSISQQFHLFPDPANPNPSMEPKPGFILEAQDFKIIFKPRE